ncbi:outer membrane protein assembly factor BamD [Singulisphaera sp. PoT]|uniref:outer membrane protein assembly factor BamD n=1 Tax=Singulisphaera sp. PoT TaxID=3411797 RepID=UPI003BF4C976
MDLANRHPEPGQGRRTRQWLGAALVLLGTASSTGCLSSGSTLTAWRMGRDSSLSKAPTKEEVGDDRNLMARWLSPKASPYGKAEQRSTLVLGSDGWSPIKTQSNPEADAEFQAAEKLFQQGKLAEAETAFKLIAKNRKGSPWGEQAQFYVAESQYQRGNLVAAHTSFEQLFADYPGTEYIDKLVSREYAIGETWLAQSDPKTPAQKKLPWYSRFNGQQPMLDPHGDGLQALEHVRHHDPTGPLADDAVMRIAHQYIKDGDYEMAAMHYDQLTTDHPKSEYVQEAQLASIDSRIKSYLGPEYDGSGLEKSRELIKQTMASFPDRPGQNEKLYHTLDIINDAEAERTFKVAEYYKRTNKITSAEFYFGKVRQRWPKSSWAEKSKTELASLAKLPRKEFAPSKIMSQPASSDPFSGGMGGMGSGGMGGMGGGGMGGMGMGPGGMN